MKEILKFVAKYDVEFPIMAKVKVNGSSADPLFKFLKTRLPDSFGSFVKWNFTKFLCDGDGIPVKRFGPKTNPLSFEGDIETLLAKEG